jgi:hypothetical protein
MTALVLPVLAAGVLTACGEPSVRGCSVTQTNGSFDNLQVQMVLPSDCPVDLSAIGQVKYTGAEIIDPDGSMTDELTTVRNAAGQAVMISPAKYSDDYLDGWSVSTEVYYPAATAFNSNWPSYGQQLSGSADDYGEFDSGDYLGTLASATVQITYKRSSAVASISGPDLPLSNTSATWSASASGGTTPYSYAWYRNGQLVSNSTSYSAPTGASEFGLRLEVTDQTLSVAAKDYWVDVDGVRVGIAGPSTVYSSEGGGTWTATGRGGYTPYSFHWYWVGDNGTSVDLGTGASYTGYPAQGSGALTVTMTDAHGRTNEQSMQVLGIGDPYQSGGCQPTPPAFTCGP